MRCELASWTVGASKFIISTITSIRLVSFCVVDHDLTMPGSGTCALHRQLDATSLHFSWACTRNWTLSVFASPVFTISPAVLTFHIPTNQQRQVALDTRTAIPRLVLLSSQTGWRRRIHFFFSLWIRYRYHEVIEEKYKSDRWKKKVLSASKARWKLLLHVPCGLNVFCILAKNSPSSRNMFPCSTARIPAWNIPNVIQFRLSSSISNFQTLNEEFGLDLERLAVIWLQMCDRKVKLAFVVCAINWVPAGCASSPQRKY